MNEPVLLDAPARLPGTCICGAVGAVIDTKLEVDGYGRVYLCAKTCAVQAASLIGFVSPEETALLNGVVDELTETLGKAHTDMEHLKANMSVPLAEVIDFLEERAKRRPDAAPIPAIPA